MSLDLALLNPEQRNAVEEIEGPCLIIAGAGSGKTRVLTYKIAYLLDSGVSPYEILALTFTNKAADEMKSRVLLLSGKDAEFIWMGTFHSMFARILRTEAEKIGFSRSFSIYDTDDSLSVIRDIMKENNISSDKINPKSVQSAISKLKNDVVFPQEFSELARSFFEKTVSLVYNDYNERLRKNNSMDFDDLLLKPIQLFSSHPDVLEKYADRFRFILVDEYQDTNRAQYIIVKMLSQIHRNLSVVGDDAQSIYKWRGAEIKNIFDFEADFPDYKIFRLERNYRSTSNILSFAGLIIKNNKKQIEKNLWTENESGEFINLFETFDEKDESLRIAKCITSEIKKKKLQFKDFAVLYRTNAQSRALEEALRNSGIPYLIVGGIRFYERKEIKDILAYLRVIVNPADREALTRVLLMRDNVGKTSVEKLIRFSEMNNITLFDALGRNNEIKSFGSKTRSAFAEVLNLVYKYKSIGNGIDLLEYVKGIIDEIGILKTLKLENTIEAEERAGNINELISAVAQYCESIENPELEGFLEKVSLVSDIDEVDDRKNAVMLMTIHSSKGLEFPVVFISGLEEGLFPVSGSLNSADEMEEERRLFYVAVTRAMKTLYITFANQRYKYGQKSFQIKSRFLKEIEQEYTDKNLVVFQGIRPEKKKKKVLGMDRTFKKKISLKQIVYDDEGGDDVFSDIEKGKNVYHDRFGKGIVIALSGKGIDKKADIIFDDFGLKRIILKYAKMRVNFD